MGGCYEFEESRVTAPDVALLGFDHRQLWMWQWLAECSSAAHQRCDFSGYGYGAGQQHAISYGHGLK